MKLLPSQFFTSQFDLDKTLKCFSAEASELGLEVGYFPYTLVIEKSNTLESMTFDFVRYEKMSDEVVAALYQQVGDAHLIGNDTYRLEIYND